MKISQLKESDPIVWDQCRALISKKSVVRLYDEGNDLLLEDVSTFSNGVQTGDYPRFGRYIFEIESYKGWGFQLSTVNMTQFYSGRDRCICWGKGELVEFVESKLGEGKSGYWIRGLNCQGKKGVAISAMGEVKATLYNGEVFDDNTVVLLPNEDTALDSLWQVCSSDTYNSSVRKIDQSSKVRGALLRVPYVDLNTNLILPDPFSNDPTQWIFHGHPCGSVIWDDAKKSVVKSDLRIDETILQVVVARLLGYQWPAELDLEMELAVEQREWVEESQKLLSYVDDDGIVCLPAVRGEKAAHQRVEEFLQAAYGGAWSTQTRNQLLESVSCKNKSLDVWLSEKFFEQHCKLFQNRPFIWHIWDGLKEGFSALVNYHQLDKKNLERLIYTYLDDWIRTQSHQQVDGVDGAAERLIAANNLKERLELILEGEAPYDIFVRWKPIEDQPIGWNPDLNDGVRLNVRPFLEVPDVGKEGAGILRAMPNIHWKKDRGKDIESTPWFNLGLEHGGKEGDRINDHHLSLAEKQANQDDKG